jgi:hypothetical protein
MIDIKAMRPALEHLARRLDARLARVSGEGQRARRNGAPWDGPAVLASSVALMRAEVRPLLVALVGEDQAGGVLGAKPVLGKPGSGQGLTARSLCQQCLE